MRLCLHSVILCGVDGVHCRLAKICFLKGTDGNEWVWVMGDAPEDESYDEIWVKYALRNAEIEAAKEISHNSPEK